mmetsp:Transcript_23382/g.43011  ORF Transcript_23382/g.43011 Transcript_23382/m.43011 type:complete len:489 (-) Transcript_23382:30-1496(-)
MSLQHVAQPGSEASSVAPSPPSGYRQNVDPEAWRSRLTVGDALLIYSRSNGGWSSGTVMATSDSRLKVHYYTSCREGWERTEKVVLRSSTGIQQYGPATARGSSTPHHVQSSQHPGSVQLPPAASAPSARREIDAAYPVQVQLPPSASVPSGRRDGEGGYPVPVQNGNRSEIGQEPRRWVAPGVQTPPLPAGKVHAVNQRTYQCERIQAAELKYGELLGSGGFGSVHRGWFRGEEVAIKKIHVDGLQLGQAQQADFEKEVGNLASLATLKHPCLIRFIGIAFEPPTLCIVTELASGGSLHSLLHVQKAVLPEARTLRIIMQVTEGVAFLHSQRPPCVHRDLKSANVVLDGDLNAKLCDFGLTESMEKTHLSRREAETGSPRYMAPEIFTPQSKLTEKLDIWSLGCVIVEVITHQLPHADCSTIQQVATKLIVHQHGPFDGTWAAGVQPAFWRLFEQCFVRDPAGRPTAEALLNGLRCLPGLYAVSRAS